MKASFAPAILLTMLLAATVFAEDAEDAAQFAEQSGDRQPQQTVVSAYPKRAFRDRIEGDVEVCFDVDRDGRTSRIGVRRSSNQIFEKPAIQAVRDSKYVALPANVALSGIKTCRTFRFRLDPDGASVGAEP
ncbi:MAG: energy transducer TonB [Proteobacteria bacterium]|nr:energy transducer TonB [Pseudomonadota bacterium]